MYGPRRRRLLLGAVLALFLVVAVFATSRVFPLGRRRGPSDTARIVNQHRTYASSVTWPQQGQAALVLDDGLAAASPNQQPVPIASLAKVMTAFLTLERYPLGGSQDGFTVIVSPAQAQADAEDSAQDQSDVPVRAGEALTELQLLEALLVPSGNNIAQMLAVRVAGSETRFLAEMNAAARTLGMDHTTYTDPSGFDPSTVSTAADQLRVFQRAMRFTVFRQIVSMASVTLPVAGTLTNFNPLITAGYSGKTGSDSAAGGCLAFFTNVVVGGHSQTAVGVVLGQGQGSDTSALLDSASEAAEQLVNSVDRALPPRAIPPPDTTGTRRRTTERHRRPSLPDPAVPSGQP